MRENMEMAIAADRLRLHKARVQGSSGRIKLGLVGPQRWKRRKMMKAERVAASKFIYEKVLRRV